MSSWEIAANVFNAGSIVLAARNSIHTWWTGIVGCLLFCWVFFGARLYADLTLQIFFVGTSAAGWWNWRHNPSGGNNLPIRRTSAPWLALLASAAFLLAGGYGFLLHTLTEAASPFFDSAVLAFSMLGQFLLMGRRIESWWCWLLVNSIGVPLYASRGLNLTSALSACFFANAVVALFSWRKLLPPSPPAHETV